MTESGEQGEPQEQPGALGAVAGVLTGPERAFASLARRPRWWLPLLLVTALAVGLSVVVTPRLDMRSIVRESLEKRGVEVSAEQLERQLEIAEKFGWIGSLTQVVIQPVVILLVAAVFLALLRMLGSDLDLKQSLAVASHGFLPMSVAALLSFPVVLSRESLSLAEVRAGGFLKSNLAFLAPEGTGAGLVSFLGSIDLFSLWAVALFAIGYRVVGRVSAAQAWGSVLGLWAAYVLGKAALAAIF
ncbi:MAG: YIP1 family protein [Thermoanaerobaculia bacterium]